MTDALDSLPIALGGRNRPFVQSWTIQRRVPKDADGEQASGGRPRAWAVGLLGGKVSLQTIRWTAAEPQRFLMNEPTSRD